MVADEALNAPALEDQGIVGEHAENQPDEQHFHVVLAVASGSQLVVELDYIFGGETVNRICLSKKAVGVVNQEGKRPNIVRELFQRE